MLGIHLTPLTFGTTYNHRFANKIPQKSIFNWSIFIIDVIFMDAPPKISFRGLASNKRTQKHEEHEMPGITSNLYRNKRYPQSDGSDWHLLL